MTDYTMIAMESCINDLKITREYMNDVMREESEFIVGCLEAGMIVFESDVPPKSQGIMTRMAAGIKLFFEKIKSMFRAKAVEQAKKHSDWIKKNNKAIKEIARTSTIEVVPYWNGKYETHFKLVSGVVDNAMRNINAKQLDHGYSKPIIDPKHVDDKNVIEYLKNFYRVGNKDTLKLEQVKIGGSELVGRVDDMVKYILEYTTSVVPAVNKLADSITKMIDRATNKPITKVTAVNITSESMLNIEGISVGESDLTSCINYLTTIVTEAKKAKPVDTKPTTEEKKKTETVDADGEEVKSPTKATVVTDDDKAGETTKNEDSRTPEEVTFINEVIKFIKLAFSTLITSLEERFITYTNILRSLGQSKIAKVDGDEPEKEPNPTVEPTKEEPERKRRFFKKGKKRKQE